MAEYIEREAVERFIESGLNNPDKAKAFGYDAVCILTEVHYMPAADVVEVVRCNDCKHCLQTSMHCVRPTAANKYPKMKADDFCSYGERREVNDAN